MDKIKSENEFETTDEYKEYLLKLAFPKMNICLNHLLNNAKKSSDVYFICHNFRVILMEILYDNEFGDFFSLLMDNKIDDPGNKAYYRFKNDYFDPDYDFEMLLCYLGDLSGCFFENLEYVFLELTHNGSFKDFYEHMTGILKVFVIDRVKKEKPIEDYSIHEYIEQCFIKIFNSDLEEVENNLFAETLD